MIAVACPYQQINLKALYVYTKTRSDVEKYVCNGLLFLGNLDPSSLTPEGPTVSFVCHFRRQDNLLARCESFVNFYGLKSCIHFWDGYNHFEGIYMVYRFTDFCQILPKHSRDNDKVKHVGKFWYLKYLSLGVQLCNTPCIFFTTPT